MSALAKLLRGRGFEVTGSDQQPSETLASLGDLGIEVWEGHRPDRMESMELVVASSAVPESDAELKAARSFGAEVWNRPQLLNALTKEIPTVGVTGTHGKSTTTAMLATGLRACGKDPSVVLGAEMVEFRTNAIVGRDNLLVLEADEAFGTFESLELEGLVVTNVDFDHGEFYRDLSAVDAAFLRVAKAVRGPVVVCGDDIGGARLAAAIGGVTYGISEGTKYRIGEVISERGSSRFLLSGGTDAVQARIPRSGAHMVCNAAGALALIWEMGLDPHAAAEGLGRFLGLRRRFENRGTVRGVTVIDDYAHHPAEVAATLTEARSLHPGRLWGVFQPHLYSRTERFAKEFGEALAVADRVVVTDIYGSREAPRPGITGELIVSAAKSAGTAEVFYVPHRVDVASEVAAMVSEGDLVVIMGAGDITVSATELLREIAL